MSDLDEPKQFHTIESTSLTVAQEGHYGTEGILITGYDASQVRQYYPLTVQTARDLAAHLIALADKLEGKS